MNQQNRPNNNNRTAQQSNNSRPPAAKSERPVRYNVVVPREYERNGEKFTDFVRVGVGFPLRNKEHGIGIELYFPNQKLLILPVTERKEEGDAFES